MTEKTEDWLYELFSERGKRRLILQNIITSCKISFLSFWEKVRITNLLFPPSPRSRLVKNVTDTKLVNYLAKYQRFSIGSLRKTADWLYCIIG